MRCAVLLAALQERAAAGAPLHDLIALSYPLAPGSQASLLTAAKSEHGYSSLRQTGTKRAADFQALKARAVSEYENLPGIEWAVSPYWDDKMQSGFSSRAPEFKLSENETLMPLLEVLDFSSPDFTLHIKDRPVIMDSGARFHAAADAKLLLDGRPFALSDGIHPFQTLSLTEAGLELSVSKPGTLTVTGRKAILSYR